MKLIESNVTFNDGQYTVPLPFREQNPVMPCNKSQAIKRVLWQKKKMVKDEQYHNDYKTFINKLLENKYAEQISDEQLKPQPGKLWYLPHHGVYNHNKPGKLRVVFDCSAKFAGQSLNDQLLQGPDLTNNLFGVLTRFRHDEIAFAADIESVFYRIRVSPDQRDFLRFMWWPNGDLESEMKEYRMNVHIFGAISSPSVANYILKKVGSKATNELVMQTIERNFYVDDCLKSVKTNDIAQNLIENLCITCAQGGFHLTKFVSNSHAVIASIPQREQAKELLCRDWDHEPLPVTRTLGMRWCMENDHFGFAISLKDKPVTRRGILSVVSSIYDPLGFVAPVILHAKKILQDLCKDKLLGWDDEIPREYRVKWQNWLSSLAELTQLEISRCYKPRSFPNPIITQLHVFADASSTGYGVVAYLLMKSADNKTCVSFVSGKARLAPLKVTTIPRLELTAAVTAVRLACLIRAEIDIPLEVRFYTDSITVLRYISNERRRFPIFVANRVQLIRDFSKPTQWYHISSDLNPADDASRGLVVNELVHNSRWIQGPNFLSKGETTWPIKTLSILEPHNDSEYDTENVCATTINDGQETLRKLMNYFSDWDKLCRVVAILLKLKAQLLAQVRERNSQTCTQKNDKKILLAIQDIESAEHEIIKWIQLQVFPDDVKQLTESPVPPVQHTVERRKMTRVKKSSSLFKLSPYLDNGTLRVGGRLSKASLPEYTKHPWILPKRHHLTTLIIRKVHERLGHAGRNHVLAELRNKYWIIKGNSAVRSVLNKCVFCRRTNGMVQEQKMADLPSFRTDNVSPPFFHTGVDYFGPFVVKDGCKEVKRYGVLFTCMSSRAVHLEIANSLETDSFINVLRRFIARRGNVKSIRSDNGTNFIGAEKELALALKEMNQDKIKHRLHHQAVDWNFNPPAASHMGGVWERMIRTVRKILSGLLQEHGTRLDTDSFHTLICEIEAIINSRPITTVSDDPNDLEALTPNHILTGKSVITVPPPVDFQRHDIYMRHRWRRVQHLANLFWSRWRNEYLLLLQSRQKWSKPQRNLMSDDVVLIKDDSAPRSDWPLGLVEKTESDSNGIVRAVTVKTQNTILRRPIHKLVLLVPSEKTFCNAV